VEKTQLCLIPSRKTLIYTVGTLLEAPPNDSHHHATTTTASAHAYLLRHCEHLSLEQAPEHLQHDVVFRDAYWQAALASSKQAVLPALLAATMYTTHASLGMAEPKMDPNRVALAAFAAASPA
jgi:hypothetical protein